MGCDLLRQLGSVELLNRRGGALSPVWNQRRQVLETTNPLLKKENSAIHMCSKGTREGRLA